MFHPPVSSARWQRASVLHRAGLLPSLFNPSAPLISALRGEGADRGPPGGASSIGWLTSHLGHSAEASPFFEASKTARYAVAKRFSDLIRIHRLGASISKRHGGACTEAAAWTTCVQAGGCCLRLWWERPTGGHKKRKERAPLCPPAPIWWKVICLHH